MRTLPFVCLAALAMVFSLAQAQTAAPDIQLYGIFKQQRCDQAGTGNPSPSAMPYRFNAMAQASAPNLIISASVAGPAGATLPLQAEGLDYQVNVKFANKGSLDAAYPSGAYLFSLTTVNDGVHTVALLLPADAYPPTPRVSNFEAAQAIDSDAPFSVYWDPFAGGNETDYVLFELSDSSNTQTFFTTPFPGTPGALDSSSTSVTLPAGTLQPGQSYSVRLTFVRIAAANTNSYPGAPGWSGYLTTTALSMRTIVKTGVRMAGLVKGAEMQQRDSNLPVPVTAAGYSVQVFVEPYSGSSISSAQLQPPTGQARTLEINGDASFSQSFDTASLLDAAFPDGPYILSMTSSPDGPRTLPLNLAGDGYPIAPHIANFEAAQAIDPQVEFTLQWDPFPAGAGDFVQLMVEDSEGNDVYMTGDPGAPGALTGTATSATIPAGSFALGRTYRAKLLLARGTINAVTSSMTAIAAHYRQTTFPLGIKGNVLPRSPQLAQPVHRADGTFGFQVVGEAQATYRIETSTDLKQWVPLFTTNSTATSFWVVGAQATDNRRQFYRVVVAGEERPQTFVTFFTGTVGNFGNAQTPVVNFPVPRNCYRVNFSVTDTSPSPANQVTVTGPAGTGQSDTPAEYQFAQDDNHTGYTSGCVDMFAAGPAGIWTVRYEGQSLQFSIPDPMVQTHLMVPLPTITLNNGNLTSLRWEFRNGSSGLAETQPVATTIQVQISDQFNNRIYNSLMLDASITSHTLPQPLNWSTIGSLNLAYNDSLGNHYVINFGR